MANFEGFEEKLSVLRNNFFSKEIENVKDYLAKILKYADDASQQNNAGLICCVVSSTCPVYKRVHITNKPQMEVFMPWFETYVKPKILNSLKLKTETVSCDCPSHHDCNCLDTIVYYELYFKPK